MACMAAIEAWQACASPSRAVAGAFDDEGLLGTEEEVILGLSAVRQFKSTDDTAARVATSLATG